NFISRPNFIAARWDLTVPPLVHSTLGPTVPPLVHSTLGPTVPPLVHSTLGPTVPPLVTLGPTVPPLVHSTLGPIAGATSGAQHAGTLFNLHMIDDITSLFSVSCVVYNQCGAYS
uniref:Uncharacterized protein n=1 Tax=Oncorhynchus tshawytscha TaxID=74940 RepID=A0AAZ3P6E0_ONCTS